MTGHCFAEVDIVLDREDTDREAARINPLAERPINGNGRSSGRAIKGIDSMDPKVSLHNTSSFNLAFYFLDQRQDVVGEDQERRRRS